MTLVLEHLVMNLKPSKKLTRNAKLEGRDHVVVPAAMMTEGVWAGSGGPLLYRNEQLKKRPEVWNNKPLVIYHPTLNGRPVSACDPEVLDTQKIGVILNTRFDDKLRTECWVDIEKAKTVPEGQRILDSIAKGEMMEISTGVFVDNDEKPGKWADGKEYVGEASNLGPDHLALLPDKTGACSIQDGAGFLRVNESFENLRKDPEKVRDLFKQGVVNALVTLGYQLNEMSASTKYQLIAAKLRETFGKPGIDWYGWVEDVMDTFFVYYTGGKLYKLEYTATDTAVTFVGEPEEVVRVTEYRTPNGKYVGNESPTQENHVMDRKSRVDQIIANNVDGFDEGDRGFLTKMSNAKFDKMFPMVGNANSPTPPVPTPTTTTTPAPTPTGAATTTTTVSTPVPLSVNEALNQLRNVSPEMAEMFTEGLTLRETTKKTLIGNILKHPQNAFTQAQLEAMPLGSIQTIANMIQPSQPQNIFGNPGNPGFVPPQSFAGAAGAPVGNQAQVEAPLDVPSWSPTQAAQETAAAK